ncbi:hypothetical protein PtA15_18A422 [Puccinia triticina]|uniref:Uncharacterized protein n=1 Tax=Puccinia triticina TaxID=208348 RepID=A0ABY7DAK7_9BASI|nr:uncharacterized protein PtA15_18A422 [Puccinia triticina]WAQ93362.1 hypothetical protein PtA15_18A422 [Puccinia triticina]
MAQPLAPAQLARLQPAALLAACRAAATRPGRPALHHTRPIHTLPGQSTPPPQKQKHTLTVPSPEPIAAAHASALVSRGDTAVLCALTLETAVPDPAAPTAGFLGSAPARPTTRPRSSPHASTTSSSARIPVVAFDPDRQKVVLAHPTAPQTVPLPTGPPLTAHTFALFDSGTTILPDPSLAEEDLAHGSLSLVLDPARNIHALSFVAPPQPDAQLPAILDASSPNSAPPREPAAGRGPRWRLVPGAAGTEATGHVCQGTHPTPLVCPQTIP